MFAGRRMLLLDLDETLVYSSDVDDKLYTDREKLNDNRRVIYLRPHLITFLLAARNRFELVILWSNGSYDYVHEIANIIKRLTREDIFDAIYTLDDASYIVYFDSSYPFKDLYDMINKYELEPEECLMIEDNIITSTFYPDIVYQIPKFNAGITGLYDRYLLDLSVIFTEEIVS